MMVEFLVTNNTDRFVCGLGLGAALVNLQRTENDGRMSVRVYSDVDKAMLMLEEALGLESYKTLPTDLDWMHLETLGLRDNVFVIPYDKQGWLSQTKRIELDLNLGAKIVVMLGRDKGTKGEVVGRNGCHFRFKLNYVAKTKKINSRNPAPKKTAMRVFGAWWIQLYVNGLVNKLDIMNVKPKLVPADFQMPPPKPRRAKRIVERSKPSKKQPLRVGKIKEHQPPSDKKSPEKKGKKSKQKKGFVEAKGCLDDMSDLYKNL